MKNAALILFAFTIISCGQTEKENTIESILEKMERRLHANKTTVVERDENVKGQGFKKVLNIEFTGCKNIDLMDKALKQEIKAFAQELKNEISGSLGIDKYKIKLLKDPNDKTPNKSGLNTFEKGFTYNKEDLE